MELRKEERYTSYAKVVLVDKKNLGYLRDLNTLGCQVDFIDPPPAKIGDTVSICIIPNEELQIPNVELVLTIRWMRQDTIFFSVGGSLSQLPEEHQDSYQKLLTYFKA